MAKNPKENKSLIPPENKLAEVEVQPKVEVKPEVETGMVKVRILPLRGIGGYGHAGDEVWMSRDEAAYYESDGYVEILKVEE